MSERTRGDASDMDERKREVEWSFWEKRHRRQSREGSGERAGTRTSFKWAAPHESTWATSEFQHFTAVGDCGFNQLPKRSRNFSYVRTSNLYETLR
jgi:hypothetical protein